jgi:hypothetical protein
MNDLLPGHTWRKSSYSNGANQGCVEIAGTRNIVGVRDSKDRLGPALLFDPAAWSAFIAEVKSGQLDG